MDGYPVRRSCAKRPRDEAAAAIAGEVQAAPLDHLFATPPRATNGTALLIPSNPFVAPVHCSRSPSLCTTSGTDGGLSDDSVFVLDIGSHSGSRSRLRPSTSAPSEAEVNQWQRELTDFFTRLDERPLRTVPQ